MGKEGNYHLYRLPACEYNRLITGESSMAYSSLSLLLIPTGTKGHIVSLIKVAQRSVVYISRATDGDD